MYFGHACKNEQNIFFILNFCLVLLVYFFFLEAELEPELLMVLVIRITDALISCIIEASKVSWYNNSKRKKHCDAMSKLDHLLVDEMVILLLFFTPVGHMKESTTKIYKFRKFSLTSRKFQRVTRNAKCLLNINLLWGNAMYFGVPFTWIWPRLNLKCGSTIGTCPLTCHETYDSPISLRRKYQFWTPTHPFLSLFVKVFIKFCISINMQQHHPPTHFSVMKFGNGP